MPHSLQSIPTHSRAAALTDLRQWHSVRQASRIPQAILRASSTQSQRKRQVNCRAAPRPSRRELLATGSLLLTESLLGPSAAHAEAALHPGDGSSDTHAGPPVPHLAPGEAASDAVGTGRAVETAAAAYSEPGPFTAMRLPKLEHTASSAFPACVTSQCLLRVTALYPKARGSGAKPPYPLAIISGGFLVPAARYMSYAEHLASWGYVVLLYDKVEVSSLEMNFLTDVVSVNFVRDLIDWTCTDGCLSQLTSPDQGVYLIGHSRGGKVSVLTAVLDRRVTALCLLDPVDVTKYAPLSTGFPSAVEALRELGMQDIPDRPAVPIAIIGGELSADCAPRDANYAHFYDAATAPTWQVVVPQAGHFQFLDEQSLLDRSVCAAGRTPDATVRAVSRAAMVSWAEVLVRRRRPPGDRARLLAAAQEQLQALLPTGATLRCDSKNLLVS